LPALLDPDFAALEQSIRPLVGDGATLLELGLRRIGPFGERRSRSGVALVIAQPDLTSRDDQESDKCGYDGG
jgi:hypothetical protein